MNALIEALNVWGARFAAFALPMLAQSAILIAALFALDALLRHRVRATVRYALWMLLLVKLLLPPTLISPTAIAYWLPPPAAKIADAGNPSVGSLPPPANFSTQARTIPPPAASKASVHASLTWPALLFALWLSGLGILAIGVGWRTCAIVQLLRHTTEPSSEAFELLKSCREQLGIHRAIRLGYTNAIGSPAICGFFRPVILIPASLPEKLSESEMRSVLLHELAHFRRGDLWVGHAQIILQLFYWYNPLLWFANRMIQRVREQAVDEMVLVEMREQAELYPETLLQVAKLSLTRPASSLGLVGILEPAGGLKERIQHILHRPFPTTARVGMRGLVLVTALALVALPMACRKDQSAVNPTNPATKEPRPLSAAGPKPANMAPPVNLQIGRNLTPEEVSGVEAKLAANPEDLDARTRLLSYYFLAQQIPGNNRQLRQGHILWLIEHHPEAAVLSPPFVSLNRLLDGSAYVQGQKLWLKQVQDHPKNLAIIEHAADYLLLEDRADAEALLKQAQAIEPGFARWPEKLGQLYALDVQGGDPTAGAKAVAELEKAQAEGPADNLQNLINLAKMSFAAGDMEKAKTYANAVLKQGSAHGNGQYDDAGVHFGNLVLGRVALHDGNLEAAKKYLLESGKTTGSPSLRTFGPNMSLAKDLLEKGEKDTVLEFFALCGKFWTMNRGPNDLKAWTEEVKAGQIPNFGGNLFY